MIAVKKKWKFQMSNDCIIIQSHTLTHNSLILKDECLSIILIVYARFKQNKIRCIF